MLSEQLRLFLLAGVIASSAAVAQVAACNGQISGTITDPSGAPVSNARVTVLNASNGYEHAATTSSGGLYRFPLLPTGEYTVTVDAPGFTRYRQAGVQVGAGTSATVNVALQLSGVATEVLVESTAPIVDAGRTDVGSNIARQRGLEPAARLAESAQFCTSAAQCQRSNRYRIRRASKGQRKRL